MKIDGYTRLAAVVAKPIKHSLSPFIHNQAFNQMGINGVYVALEIEAEDLEVTLENIRRYDMFGINLSMPYKEAVLPYLDDISPEAHLIGAVNTVVNQNGRLIGHNTDGRGFLASLGDVSISGKHLVILGAGGAALAIITQAALDGVRQIHVFVREASLVKTTQKLARLIGKTAVAIVISSLEDEQALESALEEADVLVNATSLGMDGISCPLPESVLLPRQLLVADIIYQPFETPLLKRAKKQGNTTVNGLGMLLYQAAAAFELWTGQSMPTQMIWPLLIQKIQESTQV